MSESYVKMLDRCKYLSIDSSSSSEDDEMLCINAQAAWSELIEPEEILKKSCDGKDYFTYLSVFLLYIKINIY
jgi:hypothetical protein